MADVKTIQTRLQLKYDTYANWTDDTQDDVGANLVLLKGEIGICEIPTGSAEAQTAPTVLFKVGDGTNPFKSLKWASALAADVYSWAKSETVVFDEVVETNDEGAETGRKHFIRFKTGDTVVKELDLSTFITDAEVNTIVTSINARLANIEAALGVEGDGDGDSIASQITDITDRLDVLEGEDEGSVAKAKADAIAHTDSVIGTAATEDAEATGVRKEIADAEAAAKAYTDTAVGTINAKDAEQDTAIANEKTARENADTAINEKIGGNFDAENTVAAAITAAADAASVADGKAVAAQNTVDALASGQVATNTADISQLKTDLANEITTRDNADKDLDERLDKIETFFEGAYKEDGQPLNDALDTLVEIQNLLSTEEGAAAGELLEAITDLQEIVGNEATGVEGEDGYVEATGLVKDMADAQTDIAGLKTDVATLQEIVEGYEDKGSIKTAVDAAQKQADKGVEDAGKAQAAADAAQKDVDDLAAIVGKEAVGTAGQDGYEEATGLIKLINDVSAVADDAQTRVADIETRMTDAETAITNITKADGLIATAKQEAIDTAATDASNKVAVALAEAQTYADGLNTAMNTRVVALETDVSEIKGDYLKAADVYIFACGDSKTNTHTASTN